MEDKSKKRPRDIFASLDAAFAAPVSKPASKYTSAATVQANTAAAHQAYQHKRKKKKVATPTSNTSESETRKQQEIKDPLYGRLDVDILRVGLKNCSLHPRVSSMSKSSVLNATLHQYLASIAPNNTASTAIDKLKNKVLQFDNPIKTTDAMARGTSQAQTIHLLSARQRRKLGLHLVPSQSISYQEAEQLSEIWQRYAYETIGDFMGSSETINVEARNAKFQAKLKSMDLTGCPIEVVKSRNPLNVGHQGIILAEKRNILQVLCPNVTKVLSLVKQESCFRIKVSSLNHSTTNFIVDGKWLLQRN